MRDFLDQLTASERKAAGITLVEAEDAGLDANQRRGGGTTKLGDINKWLQTDIPPYGASI